MTEVREMSKLMDAFFNLTGLLVGNIGLPALVLSHQARIDAQFLRQLTYIEKIEVVEQGREIVTELKFHILHIFGNGKTIFFQETDNFLEGIDEISLCFFYSSTVTNDDTFDVITRVNAISAILSFFDDNNCFLLTHSIL